jgi:hypothetical protein
MREFDARRVVMSCVLDLFIFPDGWFNVVTNHGRCPRFLNFETRVWILLNCAMVEVVVSSCVVATTGF